MIRLVSLILSISPAWTRAHYTIHHGTRQDVARLLKHQRVAKNIPTTALKKIKQMAAMRIPTWDQAAAAVFSSSEDSDSELGASSGTPLDTTTTSARTTHRQVSDITQTSTTASTLANTPTTKIAPHHYNEDSPDARVTTPKPRRCPRVPTWEQAAALVFR